MFGFSEYGAGITVKGPKGGLSTYASVDALEKAIKAKKAKIKKMKAARKKMGFFAPRRRMATAAIIAETRFLRALEAALKTAKAGAKARKVTPKTGAAIPTGAALTAAQIAAIQRMIQQATAQGADADDAPLLLPDAGRVAGSDPRHRPRASAARHRPPRPGA
jgi:hypothetical protein